MNTYQLTVCAEIATVAWPTAYYKRILWFSIWISIIAWCFFYII